MKLFSYDDITLIPKYSELGSRGDGDTTVKFLDKNYRLPVVPANMQDVISWELADALQLNDYFYIMHRFDEANRKVPDKIRAYMDCDLFSISLGVNDDSKAEFESLTKKGDIPNSVTIDVAHGHHSKVKEMVKWIRGYCGVKFTPYIIAGNVATADGYKFLYDLEVDAVKVGIGGGSICTTKFQTGFHVPTAYAVWECAQLGLDVPIIADGGARHYGDVAKALVLGATMVMSGGWFANCLDSPAKIVQGKKVYRGSTSYEAKGQRKHIEGRTLELDEGIVYSERLQEIHDALCSSISYAGGKDLSAFNHVEWKLL